MTRMNSGPKRESECVSTSHSIRMTQRLVRGKDTLDTDIFLHNVNDRIILPLITINELTNLKEKKS